MQLDNWDDLKFVLAMTRHGTMSAAARHLNTNVATVSRRIDRIAHSLGIPLFEKRGAIFVATRAADDLARVAETLEQTLRMRIADIRIGSQGEPVVFELAAPPAVHRRFVLPRTDALIRHLPQVRLVLTDKIGAQGLGGADIQIRIGRPEGGRLRARRFRHFALHVYHRADAPLGVDWIGLTHRYPATDMLRSIHAGAVALPRYRVEDMPMALEVACATGLPVLLPDYVVLPGHGLVRADLPDNAVLDELWLAYHETRHGDSTLRALVDWICEAAPQGEILSMPRS